MKEPLTISRAELEQSFDLNIKPLYDMNVGFRVRGIGFDNQHWVNSIYALTYNQVQIFVGMEGTIQTDVRDAFRAYLKHLLVGRERMLCMLNCYSQKIKIDLEFENDPSDQFRSNPYTNQNVILALHVLREKCAQLNPKQ